MNSNTEKEKLDYYDQIVATTNQNINPENKSTKNAFGEDYKYSSRYLDSAVIFSLI